MFPSRFFPLFWSLFLYKFVAGQPKVQLGETTLVGTSHNVFFEFFGGIPFAEPPVGALRFEPPVLKLEPGVQVFNATQYSNACLQGGPIPDGLPIPVPVQSEDCLTVNVLRPLEVNERSALPVMVWVYGGGFLGGWSEIFDASGIVGQSMLRGTPIIYVNLNYRLGALGFPQGEEAERRGATNLGNKDVIAALTWVKNNIGAFGGDPEKVSVFGESAGSILISQLLLNESFDLARAAILESGSAATNILLHAIDRELLWQTFVAEVPECANAPSNNTFNCLRTASMDTIYDATVSVLGTAEEQFPFSPVIDGPGGIIPDYPSRLFEQGQFARIPLITGTNLDEGTNFAPEFINSSLLLRQWLYSNTTPSPVDSVQQTFVIDEIMDLYPNDPVQGSPFGTGNETFGLDPQYKRASAVLGDIAFTSLRRQLAQVTSQQGVEVFAYLFIDSQESTRFGVAHGSEVLYVYGAGNSSDLSHTMVDYWLSFVATLDPNDGRGLNPNRTAWTQYVPGSENVLQLNRTNTTMIPDTFRAEQIGFLNNYPLALLH